jgi:hypothetical protein
VGADDTDRICYMSTRDGGLEYVAFGMDQDGFRQWHVGWICAVAGD